MSKATNTSTKYIDLISQNAEEEKREDLQFAAEDAALAVQSSINETKKALSKAKRDLTKAAKAVPYSLENEIEVRQLVSSLEEGLTLAKQIQEERF